jgi:hypothetical protein
MPITKPTEANVDAFIESFAISLKKNSQLCAPRADEAMNRP